MQSLQEYIDKSVQEKLKEYNLIPEDSVSELKALVNREDLLDAVRYLADYTSEVLETPSGIATKEDLEDATTEIVNTIKESTVSAKDSQDTVSLKDSESPSTKGSNSLADKLREDSLANESSTESYSDKDKSTDVSIVDLLKAGIKGTGRALKQLNDTVQENFSKISKFNKTFFPNDTFDTRQTLRLYALLATLKLVSSGTALLLNSVTKFFKDPPPFFKPFVNAINLAWEGIETAFTAIKNFIASSPLMDKLAEALGLEVNTFERGSVGSGLRTATGEKVKTHLGMSAIQQTTSSGKSQKNKVVEYFNNLDYKSKQRVIAATDLDKDYGVKLTNPTLPDDPIAVARLAVAFGGTYSEDIAKNIIRTYYPADLDAAYNKAKLGQYYDILSKDASTVITPQQALAMGYTSETYPFQKRIEEGEDAGSFTPHFQEFKSLEIQQSLQPQNSLIPSVVPAFAPAVRKEQSVEEIISTMGTPLIQDTDGYKNFERMKSTPIAEEHNTVNQTVINNNYSMPQPSTSSMGR